jgi:hypothetical protein
MLKNLLVIGAAAGVGVVVGDMVADKIAGIDIVAKQGESVKKGLRFGTQAALVAVSYSLLKSFAR